MALSERLCFSESTALARSFLKILPVVHMRRSSLGTNPLFCFCHYSRRRFRASLLCVPFTVFRDDWWLMTEREVIFETISLHYYPVRIWIRFAGRNNSNLNDPYTAQVYTITCSSDFVKRADVFGKTTFWSLSSSHGTPRVTYTQVVARKKKEKNISKT